MVASRVLEKLAEKAGLRHAITKTEDLSKAKEDYAILRENIGKLIVFLKDNEKNFQAIRDSRMKTVKHLLEMSKLSPVGDCVSSGNDGESSDDPELKKKTYLSVMNAFDKRSSILLDKFNVYVINYVIEWKKITKIRVTEGLQSFEAIRLEYDHYQRKVSTMQKTMLSLHQKGKPVDVTFVNKMRRNEEKLEETKDNYEEAYVKTILLLNEITQRSWKDLQPILVKLAQFDTAYASEQLDVFQSLDDVIEVLQNIAATNSMQKMGRLKNLAFDEPEDLYTGFCGNVSGDVSVTTSKRQTDVCSDGEKDFSSTEEERSSSGEESSGRMFIEENNARSSTVELSTGEGKYDLGLVATENSRPDKFPIGTLDTLKDIDMSSLTSFKSMADSAIQNSGILQQNYIRNEDGIQNTDDWANDMDMGIVEGNNNGDDTPFDVANDEKEVKSSKGDTLALLQKYSCGATSSPVPALATPSISSMGEDGEGTVNSIIRIKSIASNISGDKIDISFNDITKNKYVSDVGIEKALNPLRCINLDDDVKALETIERSDKSGEEDVSIRSFESGHNKAPQTVYTKKEARNKKSERKYGVQKSERIPSPRKEKKLSELSFEKSDKDPVGLYSTRSLSAFKQSLRDELSDVQSHSRSILELDFSPREPTVKEEMSNNPEPSLDRPPRPMGKESREGPDNFQRDGSRQKGSGRKILNMGNFGGAFKFKKTPSFLSRGGQSGGKEYEAMKQHGIHMCSSVDGDSIEMSIS